MRRNSFGNSAERFAFFYSSDGFASTPDELDALGTGSVTQDGEYQGKSLDFAYLPTLTDADTATIRVYMYGGRSTSAGFTGFDEITILEWAAPEPSSLALFGMGALMLKRVRNKRKSLLS